MLTPVSVGGLVKRIMAINPDLTVAEIVELVRQATHRAGGTSDFGAAEVVDEQKVLERARATCKARNSKVL